jgi:MATE family multidrug resistance protein
MSTNATDAAPDSDRRAILRLGLPFVVGVLSSVLAGVIDTAMMGHYGALPLAAVASAAAVFDVFSTLALATVAGHQILAARLAGRDDGRRIAASLRSTAKLSAVVVVLVVAVTVLFGRQLTRLVASDAGPDAAVMGGQYLAAAAPTLVFGVIFGAVAATFNAYKLARLPMFAGLLTAGSNIVLDWLLIYGPGPFPRLGAVGNGLATSLSSLLGLLLLVTLAVRAKLWQRLRTSNPEPVDFDTSIPRLAVPAMVSTALDYASTAVFFAIVGGLSTAALGGGRIAFHVMVLCYGLGTAFSSAVRILVGRAIGAGDTSRVRGTWRAGRSTLLLPGFAVGVALILLREQIAGVFTTFPEVRTQVGQALIVIGVVIPLIAWNLTNVSIVRAFGHTKLDMYGNLTAAIVAQLPIAWLLGELLDFGVVGVFCGVVAYWLLRGSLLEIWARRFVRESETAAAKETETAEESR